MANILLVDDNEALLQMIELMLCSAGHAVTTADDGEKAMRLVQDGAFDLVITDLIMPKKEGIETIMELRRKYPATLIIAMSGGGRIEANDYLAIASKLGVAKTLEKPFKGRELLAAVNTVLGITV